MGAEAEATSESSARPDRLDGMHVADSSGSYELVLSGVIFGLFGWWLDRRLGMSPVFVIVFSILGAVGGCLSLFYRYKYRIAQIHEETAALKAAAKIATEQHAAEQQGGGR